MIEVKNVTKKYGKFIAVDNISFTIKEGEIIGLLGPNGAGKSTTMNMLTGFIEQTEGEIIIDGYNTLKKPKKAKKEIGYMPEGVPLYTDLTVKEFITYMAEIKNVDRKNRKEKVQEIINKTGLKDVQKKLIKNLSRGYKQRVSMAGALIGDPKILILDEPTVGLDQKQITEIRNLIKELGKTHTVILSSHILSEVSQICNKVIRIKTFKYLEKNSYEKELEKQLEDNVEETFFNDKLIVTKDFLVDTTGETFVAVKFSDIKWVYTHRLKYYGVVSISNNIIILLNDGKTQFQCLDTKGKISDEFEKAFDKICDKLPNDSLKGYTQENIIEFKEFKKNLKSNI